MRRFRWKHWFDSNIGYFVASIVTIIKPSFFLTMGICIMDMWDAEKLLLGVRATQGGNNVYHT